MRLLRYAGPDSPGVASLLLYPPLGCPTRDGLGTSTRARTRQRMAEVALIRPCLNMVETAELL